MHKFARVLDNPPSGDENGVKNKPGISAETMVTSPPASDLGTNPGSSKMVDHYSICCTQRIVLYETKAVRMSLQELY